MNAKGQGPRQQQRRMETNLVRSGSGHGQVELMSGAKQFKLHLTRHRDWRNAKKDQDSWLQRINGEI